LGASLLDRDVLRLGDCLCSTLAGLVGLCLIAGKRRPQRGGRRIA